MQEVDVEVRSVNAGMTARTVAAGLKAQPAMRHIHRIQTIGGAGHHNLLVTLEAHAVSNVVGVAEVGGEIGEDEAVAGSCLRAQSAVSRITGSGSSAARRSRAERSSGPPPEFPSASAAFRTRPRRLARFIGEPRNLSRKSVSSSSSSSARSIRVPCRGSNSGQPRVTRRVDRL